MYKRYVDDLNLCCRRVRLGTRLAGMELEWREEWEREDLESGRQTDSLVFDMIREISDTIFEFVKLTSECPSDNTDTGFMPILDLQCQVRDNRIVHKFYEKSMNTKYCILAKSAGGRKTKFTTLVQEAVRRLRNCSDRIIEEEK